MWFDQNRELLGSSLRITFELEDQEQADLLFQSCWQKIEYFHKKYSRFISDNTLSAINSHLDEWQPIDKETFDLIKKVLKLSEKYSLNFSLAVKKTLENIGYDQNYSFQPKENINPNRNEAKILLKEPDQLFINSTIEFGGFGKGYALDLAAETLMPYVKNVCLDFGGDLFAKGKNPSGESWKIALESPFSLDEAIGTVVLDGEFLTASNTLKRSWGKDKKLHHLIDVKNQKPADYWAGSYIVADSGMVADYLATALFCTSPQDLEKVGDKINDCKFMLAGNDRSLFQHNFKADLF
ncbi:FAD:protein FMN transferase [Candidatus Peregrinibacteria bacterium]|nr:FAD:protein FMN transferase [Candidatus Peregrinibacteria bacterium]